MNAFFNQLNPHFAPRPTRFSRWSAALCLVVIFAAVMPSRAVTLRQKWMPGQQLVYEMTVGGTMTLLDDDESPQPWAGLPMDFRVRGTASANLETLAVDEAGIGTVVLRGGDSQIRAMGLGQVMEFTAKDGFASALLNGKPLEDGLMRRPVSDPDFALKLGPQGRLEGTVKLREPAKKQDGVPFDFMTSFSSWMLQAMPTLWPQHDVKEGDKWTAPLVFPLPPLENQGANQAPREPIKAGLVTFTLRGIEEVGGRKTQRIALEGGFDIDAAKAKTLNQAAQEAAPKATTETTKEAPAKTKKSSTAIRHLADAKEKLSGDLWLDTESGQLVRADIKVQGRMHTQGTITNKAGRTRPTETTADFDGSVQVQFRRISYESVKK